MSLKDEFHIWMKLLATVEGRILLAGGMLSFIGLSWLAAHFLWEPETSQVLAVMILTSIVFGRAAGMAVGYSMGLGYSVVIPVIMLIETILVLLFYPLFVFSYRRLLVIKKLKRLIDRTSKAAETYSESIRRYGIISLFIFVWSPFWMTGPVVGCAIGFLLGIRPLYTLSIVLCGTYLAISCWAIFLRDIQGRIAEYTSFAPIILVVIVFLIILVFFIR